MNGRSLGCLCLSAQTQKLFPSLPVAACLKGSLELQEYWKLINVLLLTTFCLFLELRKYQKLVEPPPSAKPITMDVDRKLEEGQKVTPVLCYRKEHLQGKVVASLNSVWDCCYHVFKHVKWVCWTYWSCWRFWYLWSLRWDPLSVLRIWITLEWLCLQSSVKTSCCLKPLSSRTSDCCVQSYKKLGSLSSLQSGRAATAQGQGSCERPWARVMTSWHDRWCVCFGVVCKGQRGLVCVLCSAIIRVTKVLAAENKNDLLVHTAYYVKGALLLIFSMAESVVYLPLQRRPRLFLFR